MMFNTWMPAVEIGAEKYTSYLKPQIVTAYLPEASGNKLLAAAKLRKAVEWTGDGSGIVRIYRPFWTDRTSSKMHPPY